MRREMKSGGSVGIHVDENRCVFYDNSNHRLIDSRPGRNPVVQEAFGFDVVSVFRRVKSNSNVADGNPLIYAMKSTNGYSIDRDNVLAFRPEFYEILKTVTLAHAPDFVAPIPSGSPISTLFARRVARRMKVPVASMWLTKKYNRDVCNDLDYLLNTTTLPKERRRDLLSARASLGKSLSSIFAMKHVESHLRHHFAPFKLARDVQLPAGAEVLLVDDILSSGSSLATAKKLFENQGLVVKCLCLFSSTGGFKRFP